MYIMDVDTLTLIQRERYNDFQREADLLRLLRTTNETAVPAHAAAVSERKQLGIVAALQQMVSMALPTHTRAVPPR